MQVQKIQNYNNGITYQSDVKNRNQNVSFNANVPARSKKGCGYLMALSLATVISTIAAPIVTYNYLSKDKENNTIADVLTSIGTGIAAFGTGLAATFHSAKKLDSSDDE